MPEEQYLLRVSDPGCDDGQSRGRTYSIHLSISPRNENALAFVPREAEPPLMLTLGRPIIEAVSQSLLEEGCILRVDLRDPPMEPWEWPRVCRSIADIRAAIGRVTGSSTGILHSRFYPLLLWAVPGEHYLATARAIEAFIDQGDSASLWHAILESGTVRLSLSESSCTVSMHCWRAQSLSVIVRHALAQSLIPVKWI